VRFDPGAVEVLMSYNFPGNVRELRNIIERCITLADSQVIMKSELPPHLLKDQRKQTPLANLAEILAEAEKAHIDKILKITSGNRTRAAELLGISRKTVWEKINMYNLDA